MKKTLLGLAALCLVTGAFGQLVRGPVAGSQSALSNGVTIAEGCRDGDVYLIEVPNLICSFYPGFTDGKLFRPEVINLDGLTIRDVLEATGTDIECEGFTLLLQRVRVTKETPYWKCTAFVNGPGSGLNTNFDSGWKFADSTMLNDLLVHRAFGIPQSQPALGNRALLFSPPGTKYTLWATYVRRDNSTGRTGAPVTVKYCVQVEVPSREQIACNIEYFSTVAAGVTQKPKITEDVVECLYEALAEPDNLEALIQFEYCVALHSIDFSVLRDMRNQAGQYDARFFTGYLIDSDEEPIGCLLIEMVNAALWN